jgi:hypothetical protein
VTLHLQLGSINLMKSGQLQLPPRVLSSPPRVLSSPPRVIKEILVRVMVQAEEPFDPNKELSPDI